MNYTICLYDPEGLHETQSILISLIVSAMNVSDRVDTWLADREQEGHMSALFPFLLFPLLACHSFSSHLFQSFNFQSLAVNKMSLLKKKKHNEVIKLDHCGCNFY